jgi:hypothetical protein
MPSIPRLSPRPTPLIGGMIGVAAMVVSAACLWAPTHLGAQESEGPAGVAAFGLEAAGAVGGSLVGVGLGILIAQPDDCGEDLSCTLNDVALVGLSSAVGAAGGDYLVGRLADTDPDLLGAALGAVLGAAAGAGLLKLLEEAGTGANEGAVAVISFSVTQGLLTAAGSRILTAIR